MIDKKFKYELVMKTALSELEFNKKTELYPNMRFEVHEDLNFTYTKDVLELLMTNKHKVCSIHLPQVAKDVMYGVKDLFLYREGLDILHATFDTAEMCYTTSKVAIVIHMDMLFKDVAILEVLQAGLFIIYLCLSSLSKGELIYGNRNTYNIVNIINVYTKSKYRTVS